LLRLAALIASDEVEARRAVTTATGRLFEGADPRHRQFDREWLGVVSAQTSIGH